MDGYQYQRIDLSEMVAYTKIIILILCGSYARDIKERHYCTAQI